MTVTSLSHIRPETAPAAKSHTLDILCNAAARHEPGDPRNQSELLALLSSLYQAGRRDLAAGRLFEGHVDALQISLRYGDREVGNRALKLAGEGALFGVWNADLRGEPLRLADGQLYGGKAFASGAGLISHALVTLRSGGRDKIQLLLLDLERQAPEVDLDWWDVLGMQRSETHLVRWQGAELSQQNFVGQPGDYEREPWFSGGALRFVAVQAGGIARLFDETRRHLIASDRDRDPHQCARLADLYACADLAAAACRQTAASWPNASTDRWLAQVAHARTQVTSLAEEAILLAQKSVGLQGMFAKHPLSQVMADLMVYLRQPAPDAQRTRVGEAAAQGLLSPDL